MARWIPLVRDGGFYASNAWTPLVMDGGYTQGGGEPEPAWEYKYVAGMSPLLLAAALGKPIKSLTQYGLCSQASTPTPSAPVDIMCNNGALRMVHRSGLPSGYKLLEYVGGSGTQYVITDLYLASTDVIECEYRNSSTTGYGAVYGIFKNGESSALYGNQTYYGYDEQNNKVDTGVAVNTEWHSSRHDFVNGTLTIDDTTVTFTPFEFTNSTKNAVLSRYYNNNYGYNWKGFVRKFKVTRNGEVVCDLLPAKNSSDVAGLYDLISGSFYTATGGTLLEGNEVDDYELSVVGTPEVISVTASGVDTQTASAPNLFAVGDYADEVEIISGGVKRKVGIKVFDGSEEWIDGSNGYITEAVQDQSGETYTPMCTHFRGTNTAPQKNSGTVRVYRTSGGTGRVYFAPNMTTYPTKEDFAAWVAAQYAQGTPVIVIYPLATETTESVTAQALSTEEGDNEVSVTANVSPIQLSAEYAILSEAG